MRAQHNRTAGGGFCFGDYITKCEARLKESLHHFSVNQQRDNLTGYGGEESRVRMEFRLNSYVVRRTNLLEQTEWGAVYAENDFCKASGFRIRSYRG